MKKTTLAVWFVVVFIFYVAYERMNAAPVPAVALSGTNNQVASASSGAASAPTQSSSGSATAATPAAGSGTPPSTAAKSAPAPQKQAGQYRDGKYTGPSANAYYGNVQVQAIVSGGKLTNVVFLDYPQTHETSVYINSQAMPYLTQEAVQAQSANVDIVSGATFTSQAFVQSLSSALAQAKNS